MGKLCKNCKLPDNKCCCDKATTINLDTAIGDLIDIIGTTTIFENYRFYCMECGEKLWVQSVVSPTIQRIEISPYENCIKFVFRERGENMPTNDVGSNIPSQDVIKSSILDDCLKRLLYFLSICQDEKEREAFIKRILIIAYSEGAINNMQEIRKFL